MADIQKQKAYRQIFKKQVSSDKITKSRQGVVNSLKSQGLSLSQAIKVLLTEENSDWTSGEIRRYW